MNWSQDKLRQFRKVLGWSYSQLGSRIGLDAKFVEDLEKGICEFSNEISMQLDLLKFSIDKHTSNLKREPLVEFTLQSKSIEQVNIDDMDLL